MTKQELITHFSSNSLTISGVTEKLIISPLRSVHAEQWIEFEQNHHPHPWSAQNIKSSLDSHICLGLWQDSALIGYAVLSLIAEESELLLFVLHRDWRSKGVAAAFLRAILSALTQVAERMYLEVRESNTAAIHLYDACGFNQVGTRPNYYPHKKYGSEDALIFAIELGG